MAFWMVSAVPTISGGHACADSAENCGEAKLGLTDREDVVIIN
jgi:hypothetical protein